MTSHEEINFTVDLAKEAGELVMQYFGTKLTHDIKTGPTDFATEADIASEKLIVAAIKKEFPADSIIAEESGKHTQAGSQYTWIIDPIDGTYNFATGDERFGVMISRAAGQALVLSVIWSPSLKLLATAIQSGGVYLNDQPVSLSPVDEPTKPFVGEVSLHGTLLKHGSSTTTRSASVGTLYALQNRYRGYISASGYIWDFAPPALMLAEAGWHVSDIVGQDFKMTSQVKPGHPGIIATPQDLHPQIHNTLIQ